MPAVRRDPRVRKVNLHLPSPDLAAVRWTLDTKEDLSFFSALFRKHPIVADRGWRQILEYCKDDPELARGALIQAKDTRQTEFAGYEQIAFRS